MDTPYKLAWDEFQTSEEYKDLMKMMRATDVKTATLYLENRIRIAFDAGWNACGKAVWDASPKL